MANIDQWQALGRTYRALMTREDRRAAHVAAIGMGSDIGKQVTITVKDAASKPVVLTMTQSQYLQFLDQFQAL